MYARDPKKTKKLKNGKAFANVYLIKSQRQMQRAGESGKTKKNIKSMEIYAK